MDTLLFFCMIIGIYIYILLLECFFRRLLIAFLFGVRVLLFEPGIFYIRSSTWACWGSSLAVILHHST
jgi:hypothetical protein